MSTESIFFSEVGVSEEIVISYFYAGFTYTESLEFFNVYHEHQINLFTLKRRFKTLNLHRRLPLIPGTANVQEINNVVQK